MSEANTRSYTRFLTRALSAGAIITVVEYQAVRGSENQPAVSNVKNKEERRPTVS